MLSTIGFENVFVLKADATVSIFMIILYTYVDSLTIYLFYMYFHRYAFYQVLYTIEFNIIILTAHYMVYHNKIVSCKSP